MVTAKISLCIPACGRPERLHSLLSSLSQEQDIFLEVIVVNTTPDFVREEIHSAYRNLQQEYGYKMLSLPGEGPSAARHRGSIECAAEYILFLDEDLQSRPGNIEAMIAFLEVNQQICCCSGQWIDHRKNKELQKRPIGFVYVESIGENSRVIFKKPFLLRPNETYSLILDDLQASIMVRKGALQQVSFDPNYAFFLELFDFFYAMHVKGMKCAALGNVVFDHYPGEYQTTSQKRNAGVKRNEAVKYFAAKWGVWPSL
jgi:GT2 family glycosyltransferase